MKPETGQIVVGGRWVTVPRGYIQAETEFTKDESTIFHALPDGAKKEQARAIVLEKRIEFYDLFAAGKADIPPVEPPVKKVSFWRNLALWSIGHPWKS